MQLLQKLGYDPSEGKDDGGSHSVYYVQDGIPFPVWSVVDSPTETSYGPL